jgi:hypothetical protein
MRDIQNCLMDSTKGRLAKEKNRNGHCMHRVDQKLNKQACQVLVPKKKMFDRSVSKSRGYKINTQDHMQGC